MTDQRLSKQTVNRRTSRAAQNRAVTEDREQTDADRLAMFRLAHASAKLPNLPPIEGFHVCWLSSTNTYDTIASRIRMGYQPIKPEEIKGFGEFSIGQGGVLDGLVHVAEMVAFKLPSDLYQMYMQENHHDAPAREDEKLTDTARNVQQQAKLAGGDVDLGDGVDALDYMASIPVPDFTREGF